MDYEKLYKESLEKAKSFAAKYVGDGLLISSEGSVAKEFNEIFPELRESEDEKIRNRLIEFISCNPGVISDLDEEKALDWLEKQGEKTEPIEGFNTEFERQISHLIASTINKEYDYTKDFVKWTSDALLNYAKHELEKQGEQKPAEWSEEDELAIERLVDTIEIARSFKYGKPKAVYTDEILDSLINWLKSLTPNHWKPSEEQLNEVKNAIGVTGTNGIVLLSLYNDIKKL